jgi:hypothetical protein
MTTDKENSSTARPKTGSDLPGEGRQTKIKNRIKTFTILTLHRAFGSVTSDHVVAGGT